MYTVHKQRATSGVKTNRVVELVEHCQIHDRFQLVNIVLSGVAEVLYSYYIEKKNVER